MCYSPRAGRELMELKELQVLVVSLEKEDLKEN